MTDLKACGRRIAQLREAEGLTQDGLAAAIGRGRSTVAMAEVGKDKLGADALIAIADHFKVPLDWLLFREVPPGGPAVGKFVDRPDQLAILAFWDGLDRNDKLHAVRLLHIPLPADAI